MSNTAQANFQSVRHEVGITLFSRILKDIEEQMSGIILDKNYDLVLAQYHHQSLSDHCLIVWLVCIGGPQVRNTVSNKLCGSDRRPTCRYIRPTKISEKNLLHCGFAFSTFAKSAALRFNLRALPQFTNKPAVNNLWRQDHE